MLYFVGLGLGDAKDVTVKGKEAIESCDYVYLESYTSILSCPKEELERFYGKTIIVSDREAVESGADEMLDRAVGGRVAFLVVGDPFGATTHQDLMQRAKEKSIQTLVIHNASITNAVASCGLWLYRFGEIVSIPFWDGDWRPDSFFDRIVDNYQRGLHTLCLLDIKVKEKTVENIVKNRNIYEPPRFMTVNDASDQLLSIVKSRGSVPIDGNSKCVAAARVGTETQRFVACSLSQLTEIDVGGPLHSLIVVGKMNTVEEESLKCFCESYEG